MKYPLSDDLTSTNLWIFEVGEGVKQFMINLLNRMTNVSKYIKCNNNNKS